MREVTKLAQGSIIPRGDSYSVVVSYKDPTGKRRQVWRTARTKREAEKLRTELQRQVDTDTLARPGKLTVQQHLDQWLQGYSVALAPRTQELYRYLIDKHIGPAIGDITLGKLNPQRLQSLYAEKMASGLSPRTVQMMHNLLHNSLANGVRTGLLIRNPVEMVDSPKVSRHEIKVMSEADIGRFLNEARKTPYFGLFYLLLFSGLRRSEALAVRWSDIDTIMCELSINRSLSYLHSAEPDKRLSFKRPKTVASRRSVSLSPSTMAILKVHREKQEELQEKLGLPSVSADGLVFCHWDGRPFLPNSVTYAWTKVARRCGLDGVRLHDARHSHASLMLKAGIHPKIVQERLGHASIQLTLDTYSRVVPGLQEAAAARFDDIVIRESVSKPLAGADNRA